MNSLAYLNKFLYKYRWRLIPGILFVVISNIFQVFTAFVIRNAVDMVMDNISVYHLFSGFSTQRSIYTLFGYSTLLFGLIVLALYFLRGIFLFFMRQTIILMSRHIEYDLKNEMYAHYQLLSLAFYRRHNTGHLMNRVSEDVSRVRMYLGPGIMYTINTITLFVIAICFMLTVNIRLTIFTILPLPVLALTIYYVNNIINFRSEKIQQRLSVLSSFV